MGKQLRAGYYPQGQAQLQRHSSFCGNRLTRWSGGLADGAQLNQNRVTAQGPAVDKKADGPQQDLCLLG